MPTKKQLLNRKNHIGGSELAAMLGLSKWKTPIDLYLDKTGQLTPRETTPAMLRGQLAEPSILKWAEHPDGGALGKLKRNQQRAAPCPHLVTHSDATTQETKTEEPVEAKSMVYPASKAWGEDQHDVPHDVIAQTHGHMLALRADLCWVPVQIDGNYRMYKVLRNEGLCRIIETIVPEFWRLIESRTEPTAEFYSDLGVPGVTPHMLTPSPDILKRLIRAPGKTVPVDQAVVHEWLEAKKALTEATAGEAFYKTNMLRELKDGDAGVYEDESGVHGVTYFETTRNEKARLARVTTFRTLRHRPKGLE